MRVFRLRFVVVLASFISCVLFGLYFVILCKVLLEYII